MRRCHFNELKSNFSFSRWETTQTSKRASASSACFRRVRYFLKTDRSRRAISALIRTRFRHLFPNANDRGYATFLLVQCYGKRKSLSPRERARHTVARNSLIISLRERYKPTHDWSFGKEGTLPWHKCPRTDNLQRVKPHRCATYAVEKALLLDWRMKVGAGNTERIRRRATYPGLIRL